jgi:hypothetical protein
MDNQTLVYELAAKYIRSGTSGNGDFNYFRDHLVSYAHINGVSFYKVGQCGATEYFLGCTSKGTLYKRILTKSYRIHMNIFEYHQFLNSDDSTNEQKAFDSEEELISEQIIPLMYPSQIGFIGVKNETSSYY